MSKKRVNENGQMRKEDYEQHLESSNDDNAANFSIGITRASTETLSNRRIIKASKSWSTIKPPSASTGENPFGKVSSATGTEENKTSVNPFASVSFASSNNNAAASPFVFGKKDSISLPVPTTSSTSTNTNPFSINPFVATNNNESQDMKISMNEASKLRLDPSLESQTVSNQTYPEHIQLNIALLCNVLDEWQRSPNSNWSDWIKKYIKEGKRIEKEFMTNNPDKSQAFTRSSKISSEDSNSFSTASTTVTSNTTITGTVKPFTGFSFGSTPSQAPATSSTLTKSSGFQFSLPTNSNNNTSEHKPKPTDENNDNDDDDLPQEEPTQVLKAENEDDEQELYTIRAKYHKYIKSSKEWKSFSAGALRCYRNKITQKCKIVIRCPVTGKVQLNLAIGKGMEFNRVQNKNKNVDIVQFMAVEDANVGLEVFQLVVKRGDGDGLEKTLNGMLS